MKDLLFREIRWFLPGPVPTQIFDWFQKALPGDRINSAFPRLDIYLVVSGREDLGLKVREGRFEIKTRPIEGTQHGLLDGKIAGIQESWTKDTWDYQDPIGQITTPFNLGTRVRIIKSRSQRTYEYSTENGGQIVPFVPSDDQRYPSVGVNIEITELYTETVTPKRNSEGKLVDEPAPPERYWTIACEANGSSNNTSIETAFNIGTARLFRDYDGPDLPVSASYGYPRFALSLSAVS